MSYARTIRPQDPGCRGTERAERLGRGESLYAVRHNWPKPSEPDRAADFWHTIHRGQPQVVVEQGGLL